MKIKEYPQTTLLTNSDAFIIDGADGTKHVLAPDAALALAGGISPEMHAKIYRGKNLGEEVTGEQKYAIRSGLFTDLFVGDYWTINDVNWRIADIDYWYMTGQTTFAYHHLVIIPDTSLYTRYMNNEGTTEGGYVGSNMYITGLDPAKEQIESAFGTMVLEHDEFLVNSVKDGMSTGIVLKKSKVEIPTENMMFGTKITSVMSDGSSSFMGTDIDFKQLALFDIAPRHIITNDNKGYWLRDVATSQTFSVITPFGYAATSVAYASMGVRPVFCIGII